MRGGVVSSCYAVSMRVSKEQKGSPDVCLLEAWLVHFGAP